MELSFCGYSQLIYDLKRGDGYFSCNACVELSFFPFYVKLSLLLAGSKLLFAFGLGKFFWIKT